MGASSVTGVSGAGAVKGMKGPGNDRNFWDFNVGPHVLMAGVVEIGTGSELNLVGTGSTVTFPEALDKDRDNYVIIATIETNEGSSHIVSLTKTNDSNGKFYAFTITTLASSGNIYYMVVNKGYGVEVVLPDGR